AFITDFREAASDRNSLRLPARRAINGNLAILERRHIGRVSRHDAGMAVGARDDDHLDVVGHHQSVGRDELKMQIGHYSLLPIFASNARVAASDLSRHPVLQKPTTLPR